MITYIDVVTGFLESGKTTFIQELLQSSVAEDVSKTVLVVCEEGMEEYEEEKIREQGIEIVMLDQVSQLDEHLFQKIDSEYSPDYIVVEYNGMWDISRLLGLKKPFEYKFRNVLFISDAGMFRSQLGNMPMVMQPHILNSDVVVFNRYENLKSAERKKLLRDIKYINPRTKVTFFGELEQDSILRDRFWQTDSQDTFFIDYEVNIKGSILIILLFAFLFAYMVPVTHGFFQSTVTVFLSILMEAVPFILLGSFLSAGIQIFASAGWIFRQISKGKWYSFLIASVGGLFFPMCDCGMVPVISGLLKNNTPLPQTITFWLASSAVSPIVILSTFYAFPSQPGIVILRVLSGIFIGIGAGILLKLLHVETKDVVCTNKRYQKIGKDILDLKYKGILGKAEAVFEGARFEFFRVSGYVILGALLSSVLQTVMPQTLKIFLGKNILLQFLIMIVAAMFMSACSTSNAFIGRSFSNNIAFMPIVSFVVLGPMVDLKNMIMLSEVMKKKFLIILEGLVMAEGILLIGILSVVS